jgi:hypothetical protein
MEAPVEIRYAGVVIGRAQEVRSADGEASFFLPGKDPMPVGTVVRLRSREGETPARVVRAVESADVAVCGMQVRLIDEAEEVAQDWIPAPAPLSVRSKPEPSTPVVEVDLAGMQAEVDRTTPASGSAAIPQAVPVAVGSSLTGALENAAETAPAAGAPEEEGIDVIIDTPPVVLVDAAAAAPKEPPVEAAAEAGGEASNEASEETSDDGSDENGEPAATAETEPATENMPPARPIAGPSGRRKTKRRRYQRL